METIDEELGEIADRAADLMFLAALIEPTTKYPMHYVCSRGTDNFIVQLSVSGRQRLIGHKIIDPEIACRFADMASLRFRKYRKHTKWNFSEAQAVADTANSEDNGGMLAAWLLARLFRRWDHAGLLKEFQPTPAKEKSNRRTVESRLRVLEAVVVSLQNEVNAATQTIASLQGPVVIIVPPIHTTDPISLPSPTFYPNVTCTDPLPPYEYEPAFYPNVTCGDPTPPSAAPAPVPSIWKAKT